MNFLLIVLISFCGILASQDNPPFFILPADQQNLVFEYVYDTPTQFIATVSLINRQFQKKVATLVAEVLNGQFNLITKLLTDADRSIDFQYHFYTKYDGSFEQIYQRCPFSKYQKCPSTKEILQVEQFPSRQTMLSIIKMIRFIANNTNLSVNAVAEKFKCTQYIRYHNEFVFRSMFPESMHYVAIEETFGNYVFDLLFEVDFNFVNDKEWLIKKARSYETTDNPLDFQKLLLEIVTNRKYQEGHHKLFCEVWMKAAGISTVTLLDAIVIVFQDNHLGFRKAFKVAQENRAWDFLPFTQEEVDIFKKVPIYLPHGENAPSFEGLSIKCNNHPINQEIEPGEKEPQENTLIPSANNNIDNSEITVPKNPQEKRFSCKDFFIRIHRFIQYRGFILLHFMKNCVKTIKKFLQKGNS